MTDLLQPFVFRRDFESVAIVTLNRPERRNAIDVPMGVALDSALTAAEEDNVVRVIVLAARGPAFCAGADLKALAAGEPEAFVEDRGWAGVTSRDRVKPMIAAVEGAALAGGCELVLACDLAIASSNASFGLPEVKHGLIAAAGGAARLPHQIPVKAAMELLLTGTTITAERALTLGLINSMVAPGCAEAAALDLGHQIALNPPLAVAATMTIANHSLEHGVAAGLDLSSGFLAKVMRSNDVTEGLRAFVEHRAPSWRHRQPLE